MSILSYCGEVTIGVMVDRCLLSNPWLLVNGFCDKVNELAKELGVLEEEKKFILGADEEDDEEE